MDFDGPQRPQMQICAAMIDPAKDFNGPTPQECPIDASTADSLSECGRYMVPRMIDQYRTGCSNLLPSAAFDKT